MEGDRARQLTTRAVAALLALGLVALLCGAALGARVGAAVTPLAGLFAGVRGGQAEAISGLGVVLLLGTPLARLVGLGAVLRASGDARAAASAAATIVVLALSALLGGA